MNNPSRAESALDKLEKLRAAVSPKRVAIFYPVKHQDYWTVAIEHGLGGNIEYHGDDLAAAVDAALNDWDPPVDE